MSRSRRQEVNSAPRPLRVAVIGCGRIARVHLRYLRQVPGIKIAALCDREVERARELQREVGAGDVFRDASDLSKIPLDAVHVLTPPAAHAEAAIAALEHGAHVLVEKPMATTSEAAERMEAAARAAGRILCVDHNRLFDPAVLQARSLVARGAIGTLLSVEAYQGVNVQEGGPAAAPLAMWLNLAPHPLYLLRSFLGDVTERYACGGPLGEVRAVLKGSQALGSLFFSPGTMPYLNALSLHGTTGTLHLDLNTMTLISRRERRLPKMLAKAALNVDHALQLLGSTVRTTFKVASGRLGTYPGIGIVIQRFYDGIRGTGQPPVTPADGRAVVELLDQIWTQAQRTDPAHARRRWATGWLPNRNGTTVLVTGAGGLLGQNVVAALRQQGHHVRAMVRSGQPAAWAGAEGLEVISGALGDNGNISRALAGVQTVVHCAARVARRGTRAEFFRDNVDGTAHLLEAAAAAGVERFVHVSSIAVYGCETNSHSIGEEQGYDPHPELRGAYTWSKIAADRLVQKFGSTGRMRTVIIRPGILVGGDGQKFTARLTIGRLFNRLLIVGRRDAFLPLCHVEDAARAITAAVTADEARGAYNIVDEPLTQDDWLQHLVTRGVATNPAYVSPGLLAIPAAVLELVSRLARRSAPTLNRYKIRRATESLRYDTSRAGRDLGWRPQVGVRPHTTPAPGLPSPSPGGTIPTLTAARSREKLP